MRLIQRTAGFHVAERLDAVQAKLCGKTGCSPARAFVRQLVLSLLLITAVSLPAKALEERYSAAVTAAAAESASELDERLPMPGGSSAASFGAGAAGDVSAGALPESTEPVSSETGRTEPAADASAAANNEPAEIFTPHNSNQPALVYNGSNGSSKVYRIATDKDYAPMSFQENGVWRGIDVDLLARAAELEGFSYELYPLDFEVIVPRLVAGKLDGAIASMNITPKRSAIMDFSQIYMLSTLTAVTKCDLNYQSLDDFRHKRVALKNGSLGSMFAEVKADTMHLILNYYDGTPECANAVMDDKADFLLEDYPVAVDLQHRYQGLLCVSPARFAPLNSFGLAVAKGENQELLLMFNSALRKMREDGSYNEIFNRYIRISQDNLPVETNYNPKL